MSKWDGKTKGSLWGYKFFTGIINLLGAKFAFFFCRFVSLYYVNFSKKEMNALTDFYEKSLDSTPKESRKLAKRNFYLFGQTLIDRIAVTTKHRKKYSHTFDNEIVLENMRETGGILISAHVGNWEIAGNLINERITQKINIVMLDAEVASIKDFLDETTGGASYNIIPIKDDMSHLILIHKALKRKELIAMHADRVSDEQSTIELNFFNRKANFPAGPFVLSEKFKVPTTFVFAVKSNDFHYDLSATNPFEIGLSYKEIGQKYATALQEKVKEYPEQWFNFYQYYES